MSKPRLTFEKLEDYQHDVIDFALANPFSAIWVDMGLGKTVSMLTLLMILFAEEQCKRALIVAPVRVAVQTWPDEIDGWLHTCATPFTLIRPTGDEPEIAEARAVSDGACRLINLPADLRRNVVSRAVTRAEERVRRRLVREETPIHIVNRERLPWLVWYWGKSWPYDTVIFDESSGLRNHKSERFRALNAVRPYMRRLHELTGTPAPETYIDLFAQIYLLDRGKRFGRSITHYRKRYFDEDVYSRKWKIKPGAADKIVSLVSDVAIVVKEEDHFDVEKPLVRDRPVSLNDAERAHYERLEKTFILELPGAQIEAGTAGALAQKLLQLSSGAVYDAEGKWHHIHDHKLDELAEIQEEAQGSPLLVAYGYKSSLQRIERAFPAAVKMDRAGKMQGPWNAGEIPMLLAHPKSAGLGLNLQKGPGHTLVFFDIPYPLEDYLQMIKRLARRGQAKLVKVFHIVARGTVDEGITPRLRRKEGGMTYLTDRVKLIRERGKDGTAHDL